MKTWSNADIYLTHNNTVIHTKTLGDGYFKFCIPIEKEFDFGWMEYEVSLKYKGGTITSKASFIRPHKGNLGIISDIDDTFLISHTQNIFKKIYNRIKHNYCTYKLLAILFEIVSLFPSISTVNVSSKSSLSITLTTEPKAIFCLSKYFKKSVEESFTPTQ